MSQQPSGLRRTVSRRSRDESGHQDPEWVANEKIKLAQRRARAVAQEQFEKGPGLKRSRSLLSLPESDANKKKARKIESAYVSRYNKQEYVKVISGFVNTVKEEIESLKEKERHMARENELLRVQIESMRCGVQYGIQLGAAHVSAQQTRGNQFSSGGHQTERHENSVSRVVPSEQALPFRAAATNPALEDTFISVAAASASAGVDMSICPVTVVKEEERAVCRHGDNDFSEIDELLMNTGNDNLFQSPNESSLDGIGFESFLIDQYISIPVEAPTFLEVSPASAHALDSSNPSCSGDLESECSILTDFVGGQITQEQQPEVAWSGYSEHMPHKPGCVSPMSIIEYASVDKSSDILLPAMLAALSESSARLDGVDGNDTECVTWSVKAA
jgi:hypothetical protein